MSKNILELTYMQNKLREKNGTLKSDILPDLKRIDPMIESIEIFLKSVTRVQIIKN